MALLAVCEMMQRLPAAAAVLTMHGKNSGSLFFGSGRSWLRSLNLQEWVHTHNCLRDGNYAIACVLHTQLVPFVTHVKQGRQADPALCQLLRLHPCGCCSITACQGRCQRPQHHCVRWGGGCGVGVSLELHPDGVEPQQLDAVHNLDTHGAGRRVRSMMLCWWVVTP